MRPVRLHWPDRAPLPPPRPRSLTPRLLLPARQPDGPQHRLLAGDALAVTDRLLAEGLGGTIDLVHLDPPFGSGPTYARLRQARIGGQLHDLALAAFDDDDGGDVAAYLEALEPVLHRCHALLSERGTLYLHLDFRRGPYARMLLDELFGPDALLNEIVWAYGLGGSSDSRLQRKHDVVYFYAKCPGKHWFRAPQEAATSSLLAGKPKRATDVWVTESQDPAATIVRAWPDPLVEKTLSNRDPERTGYPTQKPLALALRMVEASLPPGGVLLDPMAGSGTLGVAAALRGGRAILGDRSPLALDVARARLQQAGAGVRLDAVDDAWQPGDAGPQAGRRDGSRVWLDRPEIPATPDGLAPAIAAAWQGARQQGQGAELLSAWGLGRRDGPGWQVVRWSDQGHGRQRGELAASLDLPDNPEGLDWLGVDLAGRLLAGRIA